MRMYVYALNHKQNQQRDLVMTLTKAYIVEAVAEQNGYPKNQSVKTPIKHIYGKNWGHF